jgi:hypothetical protein
MVPIDLTPQDALGALVPALQEASPRGVQTIQL